MSKMFTLQNNEPVDLDFFLSIKKNNRKVLVLLSQELQRPVSDYPNLKTNYADRSLAPPLPADKHNGLRP